jgi:uncharacterized protein YceK
MTRSLFLLLLVCSPLCSGCGTFCDALAGPANDQHYYRGVSMDVAGIKNGVLIMALDVPFSACADTLMLPSIAYDQWTEPPGTPHKSALQVAGEELGKAFATDVIAPMAVEMGKANAEVQKQQATTAVVPVGASQD